MPHKSQPTAQLKDSGAQKKTKKEKSNKHSKDTAAFSGDFLY
jgi:hypothetical protein